MHVDDSEDDRLIVSRAHRRHAPPSVLVQVPDGEAALEALEQGASPTLLLVDQRLPGESGDRLVARLRARPEFAHTVVYMLTDMALPSLTDVDGVLMKHIDIDLLDEELMRLFARYLAPTRTDAHGNGGYAK
jgi:CheY-like chemotaxis protein